MAGHLREIDTNLCKSQQYNCNMHLHLKSIFKVVMETNMDWRGNIWQGNPKREAQEMWELQRDLLISAAEVKVHPTTIQPHSPDNKDCFPYPNSTQRERDATECCKCVTAWQTPQNKSSGRCMTEWGSLVAAAGENLRQEILLCFNHQCIPPHSQSLPDTEIHPGSLDKTSCHTAGWQLKVYLKHLSVPLVKQRNGTNHYFCLFLL